MKKSLESKIRVKALLIYIVVACICCGMVLYVYNLRLNIDGQRKYIEYYYSTLTQTSELIYMVNQAQTEANLYLSTKDTKHLTHFKEKTVAVEEFIHSMDAKVLKDEQIATLREVNSLLKEKGAIITSLSTQFKKQNPLDSMSKKLQDYDEVTFSDSVLIISTIKDTTINQASTDGFWRRVVNVFSPSKHSDTLVTVSTSRSDTLLMKPDTRRKVIDEVSGFAKEEGQKYSENIMALEKQISRLMLTDMAISSQISDLINKLYRQTINMTLEEIQKSEQLVRRNYTFSLIGSAISLFLILIFILLIIQDVNKGKAAHRALEQANSQIKQIMESRHQLLLAVSHDIKTPLNSILGYLELWNSEKNNDKETILSMQNAGKHVLALLDNLLEFSSLEQGRLQVSYNTFNLYNLCHEVVSMFIPLASHKNLSFKYKFEIEQHCTIYSDGLKIKQIIINILSNAVKYTTSGEIKFTVTQNEEKVHFTISDTGAGIPEDKIHRLFEAFYRVENNNTLAGGSGLGMYVVKGLIDLLNGTITVDSTAGKGTCIEIEIPVKTVEENTPANDIQKNILLVDDDLAILTMLRDMLRKLGHAAIICSIPSETGRFLTESITYDMIITDMEMGAISGNDILHKIRNAGITVPVIIMTGRSDFNHIKAHEIGFDGYLEKPISMNTLSQLLGNVSDCNTDFPLLEEMFDGDMESIRDILAVFVSSTKDNIVRLKNAIDSDDLETAQALCHKMLPMFMQVGAEQAAALLKKMETSRAAGIKDIPDWKENMQQLLKEAEDLVEMIQEKYFPD